MTPEPDSLALRVSPIISATALVAALVGGAFWVSKVDHNISLLASEIRRVADSAALSNQSGWTASMQAVWVRECDLTFNVWARALEDQLAESGVDITVHPPVLPDPSFISDR